MYLLCFVISYISVVCYVSTHSTVNTALILVYMSGNFFLGMRCIVAYFIPFST